MSRLDKPVDNSIENPKEYSVIFEDGASIENVLEETRKGKLDWEICIDMRNGTIYIGGNHDDTKERHQIPVTSYCDAITHIDLDQNKITIPHIFDWRGPSAKILKGPAANAILETIQRKLLGKKTGINNCAESFGPQ